MRETVEWIRTGAVGTVREVHAWVGSGRWNPTLTGRPGDTPPVPAGVNWDMWLGPRESRPYNPAYFPVSWRDFWAFGGSNIGDFGCHDLDAACWALNLAAPQSIEFPPAGPMDEEIGPHGCIGRYDFAANGDQQPVKVTWYDGGLLPPRPAGFPESSKMPGRGVLFIGEKGAMLCGGAGGKARLLPESLATATPPAPATIPRSKGHHRDWLDAIKGGPAASSNFEYGARLTEIVLLGVMALRSGRRIDWDAASMKARGFPEADALLHEPVRPGWEIA
jgi:predicted dehydrogenase